MPSAAPTGLFPRNRRDETNLRLHALQAAVWHHRGQWSVARALVEESAPICERLGSTWDLIAAQWTLCHIAREQGDFPTACSSGTQVLEPRRANPTFRWAAANVLLMIGYLDVAQGKGSRAARLLGAAQALWDATGYSMSPINRAEDARYHARCREQLGQTEFDQAFQAGYAMTPEAAMDLALVDFG